MAVSRTKEAATSGVTRSSGKSEHRAHRRTFATGELPIEEVEAIAKTRMHPRHHRLDALLDEDGIPQR